MAATDPTVGPEPVEEHRTDDATHPQWGCPVTWCPICVTVGAVQPLAPDVMEHLLKAASEFLLAARAVIDARAADFEAAPERSTLQKIEIS